MHPIPTVRVIRLKYVHYYDLTNGNFFGSVEGFLKAMGFQLEEESADLFFATYVHSGYNQLNDATLIFLDDQSNIVDIKFTVLSLD